MAVVKEIRVKTIEGNKTLNLGAEAANVFVTMENPDTGLQYQRSLQDLIETGDIGGSVKWNDGGEF